MVKNFWKKIVLMMIVILSIFVCADTEHIGLHADTQHPDTTIEYVATESSTLQASKAVVQITSENLRNALKTILGKGDNTNFSSDDFLNHSKFKPTTVTDPVTGVETTTAETYQLDLSNTGVKDITQLCQFEFPSTLKGINLASNGITNDHLASISNFLTYQSSQKVQYMQQEITCRTNMAEIVKIINLNDNMIDLHTTSSTYLDNTKLFFGVQMINNLHSSELLQEGEMSPCYYIRDNTDLTVFKFEHKYELCTNQNMLVQNVYGVVTDIIKPGEVDKHWLSIGSVENSPTAYFKESTWNKEFIVFNLYMHPDFKIERLSFINFKVNADGTLGEDSPIVLKGFGDNSNVKVQCATTETFAKKITEDPSKPDAHKNIVNITITYGTSSRTLPVEYIVIDTIAPVIKLIGSHHVYASVGRDYIDLGATAYDPAIPNGDRLEGEDLIVTSNEHIAVKEDTLGIYTVTYTATDYAGNTTTATRIVEIQPKALDRVFIRTDTTELLVGEEIVLVAYLEDGLKISNFSSIKYEWFVDGNKFITTTADMSSGTSVTTYIPTDNKKHTFSVKVIALQKGDPDNPIEVTSSTPLILDISKGTSSNDMVILAVGIAVLIIIIIIAIITFIKYKKSHGKTHKKHKNFHKGKSGKKRQAPTQKPDQPEIQVIKDYRGDTNHGGNGDNGTGGTGGGNSNFRLPENGDQGRDK